MKIVFASNNSHKLDEIRLALYGTGLEIISLHEAGILDELPETTSTIIGNALQKANYIFSNYKIPCFADDSGLEVEALEGRPGVDSAHYSGTRNPVENINKVLRELQEKSNRKAAFVTVLAFVSPEMTEIFQGRVEGEITLKPEGNQGFGYDPIFKPDGFQMTFGQMSPEQKNALSHRTRAIGKMVEHFKKLGYIQ